MANIYFFFVSYRIYVHAYFESPHIIIYDLEIVERYMIDIINKSLAVFDKKINIDGIYQAQI